MHLHYTEIILSPLLILLLSLFFLYTSFLITILKTNKNVTSCEKDVNKNYLKQT